MKRFTLLASVHFQNWQWSIRRTGWIAFALTFGLCCEGMPLWAMVQNQTKNAPSTNNRAAEPQESKPAAGDLAGKIKPLLEQLDADSLAERDAAEKAILELGPDVIPLLPKLTPDTPAELEIRIRRLTEKLQSQGSTVAIESTSVTLQGTMTIAAALEKITEQTGNKFRFESLPNKELTLDLEDVTFWDAVDEILDAGNLDVEAFAETAGALKLRPRQASSGMRIANGVYVESFRLEVKDLTATRSINDATQDSLTIKAWISWEPRFKPVFMQFPMKELELLLSDGTKLPATNPESAPEYSPQGNSSQLELEFTTKLPPRSMAEVKGLKGRFLAALPGKQVKLTFDKLDKPGKKAEKSGNLTVSVDRVRKNGAIYEVVTTIKLENSQQTMDSFRGWVMNNEAYIVDDKGNRSENIGWQTYKMSGNEVGINYLFDMSKGPEKYRFIYDAPGAISEREFKFKIPALPLP